MKILAKASIHIEVVGSIDTQSPQAWMTRLGSIMAYSD